MKKRVFVAYCAKQQKIAEQLKKALKRHFELVLWSDASWSGGFVLENIINEIHACDYGVAILSCDDQASATNNQEEIENFWLPRNNVALELGYFLRHFQFSRIAIVRVKQSDGQVPKSPSDIQGWLEVRIEDQTNIDEAVSKIRQRFQSNEANILHSIAPRRNTDAPGFNVLKVEDAVHRWGSFEGEFYCVNPSWRLEQNDSMWLKTHVDRYQNPKFLHAHYLVDIDRGREASGIDKGTRIKMRYVDDTRDLSGILRFIDKLVSQYPKIESEVESKMRIYIRPGIRSELTTFVASLDGQNRGFLFVRHLMENTVLEARSPNDVKKMLDDIQNLIGGKGHFSPSEAKILCEKLVHT